MRKHIMATCEALLSQIGDVPQTVLEEINDENTLAKLSELDHNLRRVDNTDDDYLSLDPAETAAIILANEMGAVLLTDDLLAQKMAKDADIDVHGSIGIILHTLGRGHLGTLEAKKLIRSLKRDTTPYLADPMVEYAQQVLNTIYPSWR